MRPATGWMAYFTSPPFFSISSCSSRQTCCACATAMPYPGMITTELAYASCTAASSGVMLLGSFASPFAADFAAGAAPNAPKMMFANERFIAFDIMSERMKPPAPSSAPAMISTLLPIANPVALAARPAYELSSEITTGMSPPPIGSTIEMPSTNASESSV